MKIIEYPKIETLFNRDPKTFKVNEGDFRLEEFKMINKWEVTEKVDGTNIRVIYRSKWHDFDELIYDERVVEFMGRTARSEIPAHLEEYLKETFYIDKLSNTFADLDIHEGVILFGEGYGEKIQGGGKYRKGVSFRLFDVWVSDAEHPMGGWWLEHENILDIAQKLGIKCVPYYGMHTTERIVDFVKNNRSIIDSAVALFDSKYEGVQSEGLVARSSPLLYTRRGKRLMWKLKVKDFKRD